MASFWNTLFGSKDKAKKFQQYTPEQMQALQQLSQGLMGGDGAFGDLFGQFNPEQTADVFQKGVTEPAMRNWQQQIMPSIMQGHADQGNSSALNNSLTGAGANLQGDLSSQLEMFMQQARMQNMQNRMGGIGMLQGMNPYQTYTQQGQAGLIPSMLSSFGNSAGKSMGYGMNPFGMMGGFGGGYGGGY